MDEEKEELRKFIDAAHKLEFLTEDIYKKDDIYGVYRFSIGKLLGKGGFGYVYELKDKKINASYAMKIILKSHSKFKIVKDEGATQTKLNHSNIVTTNFLFDTCDYVAIIMELAEKDLFDHATKNKFVWKDAAKILKEISSAVSYIHSQGYAHRDIKPENIMKCKGVWKLIDFGFAVLSTEKLKSPCCTLDYMAPEVLEVANIRVDFYLGQPTDIWALGILLYELIFGKLLFYRKSYKQTYEAISTETVTFPDTPEIPENVKSLIEKMLDKNPKTRITIEDVKKILDELLFEKT